MSYEKQTWTTGDTITANKLNHMEDGISGAGGGGGVLVLTYEETEDVVVLGQTWQEINDAPFAVLKMETGDDYEYYAVVSIRGSQDSGYEVSLLSLASPTSELMVLSTNSANGYPELSLK